MLISTLIDLVELKRYGSAVDNIMDLSAEHYKHMEENLDILMFTQRVHKPSSQRLQEWIKKLWYKPSYLLL